MTPDQPPPKFRFVPPHEWTALSWVGAALVLVAVILLGPYWWVGIAISVAAVLLVRHRLGPEEKAIRRARRKLRGPR